MKQITSSADLWEPVAQAWTVQGRGDVRVAAWTGVRSAQTDMLALMGVGGIRALMLEQGGSGRIVDECSGPERSRPWK